MSGMDASTGQAIDEDAHIAQSIRTILSTPIGTRVKRRDFGSLVPDLIDHPANGTNRLRLMAATVMAIIRWEPRVSISRVDPVVNFDGKTTVSIECTRRGGPRSGQSVNFAIALK
jgi:uncharacterized protein